MAAEIAYVPFVYDGFHLLEPLQLPGMVTLCALRPAVPQWMLAVLTLGAVAVAGMCPGMMSWSVAT